MQPTNFRVIEWNTDGVQLLDQRKLPTEEVYRLYDDWRAVAEAIREMVVRGAPAIGIAAAYGIVLAARRLEVGGHAVDMTSMAMAFDGLASTRPTAVNLFWALDRMRAVLATPARDRPMSAVLEAEARSIHREDGEMCAAMGRFGATLLGQQARVLTHCNAGALATGGIGTALGVIRYAFAQGRVSQVYADETRPFLQGARLTAWELAKDRIPVTVITDNMAAHFMQTGLIDAVIVGTDRITARGDVANKIGTYGLAVLCKHHNIPLYVIGPTSTVDLATEHGSDIIIEQRPDREVTHAGATQLVPDGVAVANPAFDITPAELVTAIVTEKGILKYPYAHGLRSHVAGEG
ncbi:MAG: S-methyl-5-thioribose-1-phosphate isomerase [Myxococcota bacterium]|nr:S-methyl-5-thioribose-1-phosphate isomerase [Myxococcota bacterium]